MRIITNGKSLMFDKHPIFIKTFFTQSIENKHDGKSLII